jgi:hypothetical protein
MRPLVVADFILWTAWIKLDCPDVITFGGPARPLSPGVSNFHLLSPAGALMGALQLAGLVTPWLQKLRWRLSLKLQNWQVPYFNCECD